MTRIKSLVFYFSTAICIFFFGVSTSFIATKNRHWFTDRLLSPLTPQSWTSPQDLPLNAFSIPALKTRVFGPTQLSIIDSGQEEMGYVKYLVSFSTLGKRMTAQLNIPNTLDTSNPPPLILMLRGYVPLSIYETGMGTKNAAARFAQAGYITIAPDFFGFGQSDPEPDDTWQARFEKPAIVAELIATVKTGIPVEPNGNTVIPPKLGIWAHSNGGQIALTTLEVLRASYPTTLWAPVTAPFPYSILYFGDEVEDEGKAQRAWIALFERDYDVHKFSHTQYLPDLRGPLQFQQGTSDDAVPYFWTDEFIDKLETENLRRRADASAPAEIEVTHYTYPGADHNLVGAWETAIRRDLEFFTKYFR